MKPKILSANETIELLFNGGEKPHANDGSYLAMRMRVTAVIKVYLISVIPCDLSRLLG